MFASLHAPGNLPILVKCAEHFSPLIEETSPDTVVFDIRGLGRICGTAEQIAAEIQSRVGIPAEKGDPFGQMKLSSRARAQAAQRDATALLTACGLALRSFD